MYLKLSLGVKLAPHSGKGFDCECWCYVYVNIYCIIMSMSVYTHSMKSVVFTANVWHVARLCVFHLKLSKTQFPCSHIVHPFADDFCFFSSKESSSISFPISQSSRPHGRALQSIINAHYDSLYRADSKLAPSQWETSLQNNAVSHWLGAILESALLYIHLFLKYS